MSRLQFVLLVIALLLLAACAAAPAPAPVTQVPVAPVVVAQATTSTSQPTIAASRTPTATPAPARTRTPTATASPTVTLSPTASPTSSPTATHTPTTAYTPTETPSPTLTRETYYEVTEITLPTYSYAGFVRPATDPTLGDYPLRVLDREAYEATNPQPVPQRHRLLVLENDYIRLSILPDLGGRIYECTFKPTGHNQFYSNPVVKPTQWGPPSPPYPAGVNWWLALGGLEWGFPVEEHGYEWSASWGFDQVRLDNGGMMITLFTRGGPQNPYAIVDIILPPDTAYFVVQPAIINPWATPFRFKWWSNAMLAPGAANKPGPDLRFIFPVSQVTVHSTEDRSLPAAGQPMTWPVYAGRDMSRLGNWTRYLGAFQSPAARGDFMGVYDTAADEGMLRIYPSRVARGAKFFAPGWAEPLDPDAWTDDGSGYVELHGGLLPDFEQWYELRAGGEVTWSETWYPVAGIGGVTYANSQAALSLAPTGDRLRVGLYPTTALAGRLTITLPGADPVVRDIRIDPAHPFLEELDLPPGVPAQGEVSVTLTTAGDELSFEWRGAVRIRN